MPTNRQLALRKYRLTAAAYDHVGDRLTRRRDRAVELLRLKPGDVVLDVGCGTGLSFPSIEQAIGADGRIVGIEQSPEMLARARERVEERGWPNVILVGTPAEEADIPGRADAALFCFVHDILQTPGALENVFRHLRLGGHVAAAGTKWAPRWLLPVNLYVLYIARAAMTTREGLGQPWRNLARFVPDLHVEQAFPGHQYVANGTASADLASGEGLSS